MAKKKTLLKNTITIDSDEILSAQSDTNAALSGSDSLSRYSKRTVEDISRDGEDLGQSLLSHHKFMEGDNDGESDDEEEGSYMPPLLFVGTPPATSDTSIHGPSPLRDDDSDL